MDLTEAEDIKKRWQENTEELHKEDFHDPDNHDIVVKASLILIPKKGNAKECSNYCAIALISHASKVMLKILHTRLQQYVNQELPDVQAGFRKGIRTRDQTANIC